jgi:hypothetical protein
MKVKWFSVISFIVLTIGAAKMPWALITNADICLLGLGVLFSIRHPQIAFNKIFEYFDIILLILLSVGSNYFFSKYESSPMTAGLMLGRYMSLIIIYQCYKIPVVSLRLVSVLVAIFLTLVAVLSFLDLRVFTQEYYAGGSGGVFNGSSDASAFWLGFLMLAAAFDVRYKDLHSRWILIVSTIASCIGMLTSGSRAGIIYEVILLLYIARRKFGNIRFIVFGFFAVTVSLLFAPNLDSLLALTWHKPAQFFDDITSGNISAVLSNDESLLIRYTNYKLILSDMGVVSSIIGNGPGFFKLNGFESVTEFSNTAIDNFVFWMFFQYGVIGCWFWWRVFYSPCGLNIFMQKDYGFLLVVYGMLQDIFVPSIHLVMILFCQIVYRGLKASQTNYID